MNRMRATAAVLATASVLTAAQLGLAGAASAATRTPAGSGCPIDIVYPSRFYIDSHGWVTGGGLYFGIKSKTAASFKKVTFSVSDMKNIRFGKARPSGGRITHNSSTSVSVSTGTFKGRASLGMRIPAHLLNTRSYEVKFTLHGSGWNCAVNQGAWGN
ncbi:hypothetical protein A6P39_013615 [Streptomyces sp. FXJ1.172]|uniref:hypothetical protein n=1 Tax=Streptomyces sp. FXJ1.172 TaxID=710705 RepID=UPI0007CF4479|nr:hypothetical protein [Streptomyces sp. FXJ1.172]WEO94968.1 hypothetical protein A6P39_013615 [Streptomyces sp. FXJ1.172]